MQTHRIDMSDFPKYQEIPLTELEKKARQRQSGPSDKKRQQLRKKRRK